MKNTFFSDALLPPLPPPPPASYGPEIRINMIITNLLIIAGNKWVKMHDTYKLAVSNS
jgi:hypothetical protein